MTTDAPLLGEPLPVELMNTIWGDRAGIHDALEQPDEVVGWLAAIGTRLDLQADPDLSTLTPARRASLRSVTRDLRDALRHLAADVTDDERAAAVVRPVDLARAVGVLNAAAARAPRWSVLELAADGEPTRSTMTAESATDAALSQVAELGIELFAGPQRSELRACPAPSCVLYFVKNHPRREWCSESCGNRARQARHYQRRHPQDGNTES